MSIHIVILTQVGVPILDLGVNVTKDTAQKYHLLPIKIFYILSLTNRDVGLRMSVRLNCHNEKFRIKTDG